MPTATEVDETLATQEQVALAPVGTGDRGLIGFGNQKGTRAQHCYWRRPDGWIIEGPAWESEYVRQIQEGMQPLDQKYGRFLDDAWKEFHRYPLRGLFERRGHQELPPGQILAFGWHRQARLRRDVLPFTPGTSPNTAAEDVFPQLRGLAYEDIACPHCPNRAFVQCAALGLNGVFELRKHESIMHQNIAQQSELARRLAEATEGQSSAMAEALRLLAQAVAGIGQRLDAVEAAQSAAPPRERDASGKFRSKDEGRAGA